MNARVASLAGVFAAIALVVGAGTAGADAPASYTCTGTFASPGVIPPGTYLSLAVPAGAACSVVAPVTVLSPVSVGASGGLAVFDGSLTVHGGVTVGPGAVFGNLFSASPITINGPLTIGSNAAVAVGLSNPGGPLVSAIRGPVTATNASGVNIFNTLIAGPVKLVGGGDVNPIVLAFVGPGANVNDLEDNRILGPVTMTGYHGVSAGVFRNQIFGPLIVSSNHPSGDLDIGSNTIYGSATCNDNSPAPNTGATPGAPSTVFGPVLGNQAATCVA